MGSRVLKMLVLVGVLLASVVSVPRAEAGTTRAGRYKYVTRSIALEPGAEQDAAAFCPSGRAVGAGGAVSGSAWMERMEPIRRPLGAGDPDDGSVAQAWNDGGTNVRLSVTTVCMLGEGADHISYNPFSTTTPPGDAGSNVVMSCGATVVGGGAGIDPDASIGLTGSVPNTSAWYMTWNNAGAAPGKEVSALLICNYDGALTSVVRTKTGTVRPNKVASLNVGCPRRMHATAGGVGTDNGLIRRSLPFDGGDNDAAPDDGWRGTVYNPQSEAKTFGVNVVCMR